MSIDTTHDVAALVAENGRLRAIVDRVEALASGARVHWNAAPRPGTLAVVEHAGGWQDIPPTTRVYARVDDGVVGPSRDPYFPDSGNWYEQGPDADDRPLTWGELNWLDDPACDRGTVSIETFVSVDALDETLGGGR